MIPHSNIPPNINCIVFGVVNEIKYTNWKGETELRKVIPCVL